MGQRRTVDLGKALLVFGVVLVLILAAGIVYMRWNTGNERYYSPEYTLFDTMVTERAVETFKMDTGSQTTTPEQQTKVIYTADLGVEMEDVEAGFEALLAYSEAVEGHIAESSRWVTDAEQNFFRVIMRIPSPRFNEAVAEVSRLGKVTSQSIRGEDVTQYYYDLEARLNSKLQQEQRYLEILETATTVEDVLHVEKELERIRSDIESMQGTLRYYADRTDMATLTVTLQDKGKTLPLFELDEISDAFGRSIRAILLFGALAAPWILVVGVALLVVRSLFWRGHR